MAIGQAYATATIAVAVAAYEKKKKNYVANLSMIAYRHNHFTEPFTFSLHCCAIYDTIRQEFGSIFDIQNV